MISVIGLGELGTQIADKFSQYPQYQIYKIGHDLPKGKRNKNLKKYDSPEEYEKKCPSMKTYFKDVADEVLLVCDGSEYITSSALRILEQVKNKKLNVLYLKPDLALLEADRKRHEKLAFNVFQQYARSGLLDRVYLVDMNMAETAAGNLPIDGYYDHLYEFISYTFHMINVYGRTKGLIDNFQPIERVNRITTFGISNLENEDRMFFSLDSAFEMGYYYAVSKRTLEKDDKLLPRIKRRIKAKSDEFTRIMFSIHQTEYDDDYVYCVKHTKFIQGEENVETDS